MEFSIVSYNVLANSYIRPEWYSCTPAEVLAWPRRKLALTEKIISLAGDLICLQEVEKTLFNDVLARLNPLGYSGRFLRKGCDKPDGCATFFRCEQFTLQNEKSWHFLDGTGHVALALQLQWQKKSFLVANTHLKWSPPGTSLNEQSGLCQISEVLQRRAADSGDPAAWIVCGDFNVTPDSPVIRALLDAELQDVFGRKDGGFTCNSNRRAKRIDYIFYGRCFTAIPDAVPAIDDDTPLPSETQPSDHLPIRAMLRWREPEE